MEVQGQQYLTALSDAIVEYNNLGAIENSGLSVERVELVRKIQICFENAKFYLDEKRETVEEAWSTEGTAVFSQYEDIRSKILDLSCKILLSQGINPEAAFKLAQNSSVCLSNYEKKSNFIKPLIGLDFFEINHSASETFSIEESEQIEKKLIKYSYKIYHTKTETFVKESLKFLKELKQADLDQRKPIFKDLLIELLGEFDTVWITEEADTWIDECLVPKEINVERILQNKMDVSEENSSISPEIIRIEIKGLLAREGFYNGDLQIALGMINEIKDENVLIRLRESLKAKKPQISFGEVVKIIHW
jgi:hypothetical protein